MRFVWFWTFWHWSTESCEAGSLLRSPIHGIGSHWDEWFRHEASPEDRLSIEEVGRSARSQRRFIGWLVRRWSREARWRGNPPPVRFVLGRLAGLPPFDGWSAFEKYRGAYGGPRISAIVLGEESAGGATDVRVVEALALPVDTDPTAPPVVAEGFDGGSDTLVAARRAAMNVLGGSGLALLLAMWIAAGRRPYARTLGVALAAGWLVVAGLIVLLLAGADPGERLQAWVATLTVLWAGLVAAAVGVAVAVCLQTWRAARRLRARLAGSQLRVRMEGGLRLQGDSAGLPFSIAMLLALERAEPLHSREHVWRPFFRRLRSESKSWAATGALRGGGWLEPVVLEPKIRASLRHPRINHLLTPRQRDATPRAVGRVADAIPVAPADEVIAPSPQTAPAARVPIGFAASRRELRAYRCRHLAHAVMAAGGLTSRSQIAANLFALAASVAMLFAMPDVLATLRPPPAPAVVAPSSPSPYYLWVSLDTEHPDDFSVVLESDFWANRRAVVAWYGGANASARAEIRLRRLVRQPTQNEEDGVVWVERRRRFLTREFMPGERVGRYFLSYVTQLKHE